MSVKIPNNGWIHGRIKKITENKLYICYERYTCVQYPLLEYNLCKEMKLFKGPDSLEMRVGSIVSRFKNGKKEEGIITKIFVDEATDDTSEAVELFVITFCVQDAQWFNKTSSKIKLF